MKRARLQVGLDISQKHLDLCALHPDGRILVKHQRYANSRQGYAQLKADLLSRLESPGLSGLDLGGESTGYYWLPLFLTMQADEAWQDKLGLYLFNSRQVHWYKKAFAEDDKTDAKDGFYVAEKLRTLRRKQTWQGDLDWLRLRCYSRLRFHLGQNLSREKNYFWAHMFLLCSAYRTCKPFGDGLGACGRALVQQFPDWQKIAALPLDELVAHLVTWSRNKLPDPRKNATKLRQAIASSYPLPAELTQALHDLLNLTIAQIAGLEKQAAQVEAWLQQEIDAHHPEVNHLIAIKGLGSVLPAGIAAEIGNLECFFRGRKWDRRKKRFRRKNLRDVEDAVAKFAGIWWPRRNSGDFQGQERRMNKKGNHYLRYYLVQAADKLRQYQPEYRAFYQRKYAEVKKHQHKRALVLTARKSVGLFVGLLHRNEPYRPREVSRT